DGSGTGGVPSSGSGRSRTYGVAVRDVSETARASALKRVDVPPSTRSRMPPAATAHRSCLRPRPISLTGLLSASYTGARAALAPEVHTSNDPDPVRYVRWRGTVPTFDGMPLAVDITVPCGDPRPRPAVVMLHGFTDDKTVWEETGKSDTVHSRDRPGSNDRWNNIWFASRGYVVVNYTARGWNDSCGPRTPGHSVAAPAPQCAPYAFWIHLDDKRWEVRDAQWLAGGLVQSGYAD